MKHAFLITAYKNAPQLAALVRRLEMPGASFFIHIDKKSEILGDPAVMALAKRDDTKVLSRFRVSWGGYSHLRALLLLMEQALDGGGFDYCHTLSGQCWPTVPPKEFDAFFQARAGDEFISCEKLTVAAWPDGGLGRYERYDLRELVPIFCRPPFLGLHSAFLRFQEFAGIRRPVPEGITALYGGGAWFSVSRAAVEEVVGFLRAHPRALASMRHTYCPEEAFFHSVLMNSGLRDRVAQDDLRYVVWARRDGYEPARLDERDYDEIRRSGKLFARKMAPGLSEDLQRMLDQGPGE